MHITNIVSLTVASISAIFSVVTSSALAQSSPSITADSTEVVTGPIDGHWVRSCTTSAYYSHDLILTTSHSFDQKVIHFAHDSCDEPMWLAETSGSFMIEGVSPVSGAVHIYLNIAVTLMTPLTKKQADAFGSLCGGGWEPGITKDVSTCFGVIRDPYLTAKNVGGLLYVKEDTMAFPAVSEDNPMKPYSENSVRTVVYDRRNGQDKAAVLTIE